MESARRETKRMDAVQRERAELRERLFGTTEDPEQVRFCGSRGVRALRLIDLTCRRWQIEMDPWMRTMPRTRGEELALLRTRLEDALRKVGSGSRARAAQQAAVTESAKLPHAGGCCCTRGRGQRRSGRACCARCGTSTCTGADTLRTPRCAELLRGAPAGAPGPESLACRGCGSRLIGVNTLCLFVLQFRSMFGEEGFKLDLTLRQERLLIQECDQEGRGAIEPKDIARFLAVRGSLLLLCCCSLCLLLQ
jgi:hypothetical protein